MSASSLSQAQDKAEQCTLVAIRYGLIFSSLFSLQYLWNFQHSKSLLTATYQFIVPSSDWFYLPWLIRLGTLLVFVQSVVNAVKRTSEVNAIKAARTVRKLQTPDKDTSVRRRRRKSSEEIAEEENRPSEMFKRKFAYLSSGGKKDRVEEREKIAREEFIMGGVIDGSNRGQASRKSSAVGKSEIFDRSSLSAFLEESENLNTQNKINNLKMQRSERFDLICPADASRNSESNKGFGIEYSGLNSFSSYRQGLASREFIERDVSLTEDSEKIYNSLGIFSKMHEFSAKTRENISNVMLMGYKKTVEYLQSYFFEARDAELKNAQQVPEWRRMELKSYGSSFPKIYRYFKKYHGSNQNAHLQEMFKNAGICETIESSIAGAQFAQYCKSRLVELGSQPYMPKYCWNEGGDWKGRGWNQNFPSDALLIMRCFCSYVTEISGLNIFDGHYVNHNDASAIFHLESANPYNPSVGYVDLNGDGEFGDDLPIKSVAIVEYSADRFPHFAILVEERILKLDALSRSQGDTYSPSVHLDGSKEVLVNNEKWQLWQAHPGPENVFHAISLFIYVIQTMMKNQLGSFNPKHYGLQLF